jgi:hypothetical protein
LLDRRREDGTCDREHWEVLAERGDRAAIKRLEPPEYPSAFEYLREWLFQLHGRSGVGMNGFVPLTWTTLRHWRAETGTIVRPAEARALMRFDAILLHPDPDAPRKSS